MNEPAFAHCNESETAPNTSIEGMEAFFAEPTATPFEGLTIKEAAQYFGISAKKVRKRIVSGEIEATRSTVAGDEKWLVFPDGVPEQLQGERFQPQPEPKGKKLTKTQQLLLRSDVQTLQRNVEELNRQIGGLCDSVTDLNHEVVVLKQVLARIGVSTTWVDENSISVHVDRGSIETFPRNALITVDATDATICSVEDVEEEQHGRKKGGWLGNFARWLWSNL